MMLAREMAQRLRQPQPETPAAEPEPLDAEEPEDAELSDAEFLKQLRADVEGVKVGLVPAGSEDVHPAPKDRPWSPKRKRRDRRECAF